MKLKEYAELNDITLADAKKRTGLTHWNQEVVEEAAEEVVEIVEEAVKDVAKVVVEAVVEIVSKEDKIKSVRGLGTKSKYWSELNG